MMFNFSKKCPSCGRSIWDRDIRCEECYKIWINGIHKQNKVGTIIILGLYSIFLSCGIIYLFIEMISANQSGNFILIIILLILLIFPLYKGIKNLKKYKKQEITIPDYVRRDRFMKAIDKSFNKFYLVPIALLFIGVLLIFYPMKLIEIKSSFGTIMVISISQIALVFAFFFRSYWLNKINFKQNIFFGTFIISLSVLAVLMNLIIEKESYLLISIFLLISGLIYLVHWKTSVWLEKKFKNKKDKNSSKEISIPKNWINK